MKTSRCIYLPIIILMAVIWLVSCKGPVVSGSADQTVFLPPTLEVTPTPSVPPTPTYSLPTSSPECTNNLLYLDDLTIPDGTIVSPGASLDKKWLVQNNGTCNWDDTYKMKLVDGTQLGAASEQTLYPARVGAEATLRIQFQAPSDPGAYTSAWQAIDPSGAPFGDPFYIEIIVQ